MFQLLSKILPYSFVQSLNLNKLPVLFAASLIIFLRFISDILFYYIGYKFTFTYAFWQLFTGLFTVLLFFVYLIPNNYLDENQVSKNNKEFFTNLKFQFFFLLSFITYILIYKFDFIVFEFNKNFISLFIIDFYSPLLLIVCLFSGIFIWKWLNVFKHKNTNIYSKYIFISISLILISSSFIYLNKYLLPDTPFFKTIINISDFLKSNIFEYLEPFSYLALGILIYLINERNIWIQRLSKGLKFKLILYSVIFVIINLIIFFETQNKNSQLYILLFEYFSISVKFVNIISFIGLNYFAKLILVTLLSLPNTEYMIQINSKLDSLTELNKIIFNSKNINDLLSKVNEYSYEISKGYISWIEVYNSSNNSNNSIINKNIVNYVAVKNVDISKIQKINENSELQNLLFNTKTAYTINSLKSENNLKYLIEVLPNTKSITIIPLFDMNSRYGTITILHEIEYPLENEDLNILQTFAYNVGIAIEQNKLIEKSIENERYKRELALAQIMQKKLLPKSLPKVEGFQIEAFSLPAEEVGGDYYDFFNLKNGNLCILLGDVSGKGLSAAFIMAQIKGIAQATAYLSNSVEEFVKNINRAFYSSKDKKNFITIAALELIRIDDKSPIKNDNLKEINSLINQENSKVKIVDYSYKIKYVRAGHTPLIIIKSDQNDLKQSVKSKNNIKFLQPKGYGIGIVDNLEFDKNLEVVELEIEQNDKLLIFTDGLNEIRYENNDELGFEGVARIFDRYSLSFKSSNQTFQNYLFNSEINNDVQIIDDLSFILLEQKNIS